MVPEGQVNSRHITPGNLGRILEQQAKTQLSGVHVRSAVMPSRGLYEVGHPLAPDDVPDWLEELESVQKSPQVIGFFCSEVQHLN